MFFGFIFAFQVSKIAFQVFNKIVGELFLFFLLKLKKCFMNLSKVISLFLLLFLCSIVHTQNLIPNPSFETGPCPTSYVTLPSHPYPTSWRIWPTASRNTTSDYFKNGCYTGGQTNHPNPCGAPVSGNAWMGVAGIQKPPCTSTQRYIEGLRAPLNSTLINGTTYQFSINLRYVPGYGGENGMSHMPHRSPSALESD